MLLSSNNRHRLKVSVAKVTGKMVEAGLVQ